MFPQKSSECQSPEVQMSVSCSRNTEANRAGVERLRREEQWELRVEEPAGPRRVRPVYRRARMCD